MSSAVDNLADNLNKATVGDHATSAADKAATASAAEGRRLYIGNLAYATTEAELKDFFKGYEVEATSIPVNPRTNRPVGYAFVDLVKVEDAQKAIDALSGGEVMERKVSVQLARKPEETPSKTITTPDGEKVPARNSRGRGGRGRGRGGRTTSGRGGKSATEIAEEGVTNEEVVPLTEKKPNVKADTPAATTATTATGADAAADAEKTPRQPRQPKQRGPPEDGIASTTKVMVANLPYDLTEEKLKELFADYKPLSAKIALRPIPRFMVKKLQARNEPRKGRGFGFVTLESETLQQKAVSEMNGKQIEGREIAVKVAIDSPGKEDGAEHNENGNGATALDTSTSTGPEGAISGAHA